MVKVATGSSKCRARSTTPPPPTSAIPPAGSQPNLAANTRISIRPIQKLGSEMLTNDARLIAWSRRDRDLSAARIPSGNATARARPKLTPMRSAVRPSGITLEERLVDPHQCLEPRYVRGREVRIGPQHEVDGVARHQPDQAVDQEGHRRDHDHGFDQAAEDVGGHDRAPSSPAVRGRGVWQQCISIDGATIMPAIEVI